MQVLWENGKNGGKGWIYECLSFCSSPVSCRFCLGLHCSHDEVFLHTRVGVAISVLALQSKVNHNIFSVKRRAKVKRKHNRESLQFRAIISKIRNLTVVLMDNIASNKIQPGVRKVKKKQVKDELDRMKQAEKKKKRLEKALATSAAIRAELEKKKQKRKEEQQRLDDEGAAIAEAVALRVLLGEDSDESCNIVLNNNFNPWDCAGNIGLLMDETRAGLPHEYNTERSLDGIGWVSNPYGYGCNWGVSDGSCYSRSYGGDVSAPYFEGEWGMTGFSADLIAAAQAMSSLHIAEDA